jgi:hypothetical protein
LFLGFASDNSTFFVIHLDFYIYFQKLTSTQKASLFLGFASDNLAFFVIPCNKNPIQSYASEQTTLGYASEQIKQK